MKTKVKNKKAVLINFSKSNIIKPVLNVVDIKHNIEPLKQYRDYINASLIDVVEYNDNIDIVIDDEGLLVEGNPVYEILTPDGCIHHLAGKLLFLKKRIVDGAVELEGMDLGEVLVLVSELSIRTIGVTRGS